MDKDIRDQGQPAYPFVLRRSSKPVLNFRKSWKTACAEAGTPDLLFHDLRRTAVRNMVRAGIPEEVGMQISHRV
jgi:hypothetical protein